MRTPLLFSALIVLAGCTSSSEDSAPAPTQEDPAPAMQTLDAMPEAFRGRWDLSEEGCTDESSEMRLLIAADTATFYGSRAQITAIEAQGEQALIADHRFSGEDETWDERLAYELSEDGERLTVETADGSLSIRMRCP
jgi:predicted secreted protein